MQHCSLLNVVADLYLLLDSTLLVLPQQKGPRMRYFLLWQNASYNTKELYALIPRALAKFRSEVQLFSVKLKNEKEEKV